jgi:hypothetical protein
MPSGSLTQGETSPRSKSLLPNQKEAPGLSPRLRMPEVALVATDSKGEKNLPAFS